MMRRIILAVCLALVAGSAAMAAERLERVSRNYKLDVLGGASPMHGIQGIALGPDGALYAVSVAGRSIYRIDIATGAIKTFVGPPQASADDLAFAPDGTVAWTNILEGTVYARGKDGKIRALARNLPGVNAIAFTKTGRLFVTCVLVKDGLYEIDRNGIQLPRAVLENIGNLNAFQFVDDTSLYGPATAKGKVVKIDVDTGAMADVATGFKLPVSVRIERDGHLIVIDHKTSEVFRVDPATGERTKIAALPSILDNSAIGADGTIYLSATDDNGIVAVDPKTLAQRRVTWSDFSGSGFISVVEVDGKEQLLLADIATPRFLDPETGKITTRVGTNLRSTLAIAMGPDMYVASLRRSFMTGASVQVLDRAAKQIAELTDFKAPYDVKLIDNGFVVADYGAGEVVVVGNGPKYTRALLAEHLAGPVGLADAGGGAFYVSEHTSGRILRVDSTGAKSLIVAGLKGPEGIARTRDGRLIVAEVGRKRIIAVDVDRRRATTIAENLALGLDMDPQNPAPFLPTGVAVDNNGRIYVPSDVKNIIYRLTPSRP